MKLGVWEPRNVRSQLYNDFLPTCGTVFVCFFHPHMDVIDMEQVEVPTKAEASWALHIPLSLHSTAKVTVDHQKEEEGQHAWWRGTSWTWTIVWTGLVVVSLVLEDSQSKFLAHQSGLSYDTFLKETSEKLFNFKQGYIRGFHSTNKDNQQTENSKTPPKVETKVFQFRPKCEQLTAPSW